MTGNAPIISIHALREEGDTISGQDKALGLKFLSTPSARRATESGMGLRAVKCISIHALREEGDGSDLHQSTLVGLFLSTPSARRATPTKR